MRALTALLVMMTGPALADGPCIRGTDALLTVTDWSATDSNTGIQITVTIRSNGRKNIKMIEGAAYFKDALGRQIGGDFGGAPLNPDLNIGAGQTIESKTRSVMLERLLTVGQANVKAFTCVLAVLYEDGTKETF